MPNMLSEFTMKTDCREMVGFNYKKHIADTLLIVIPPNPNLYHKFMIVDFLSFHCLTHLLEPS